MMRDVINEKYAQKHKKDMILEENVSSSIHYKFAHMELKTYQFQKEGFLPNRSCSTKARSH